MKYLIITIFSIFLLLVNISFASAQSRSDKTMTWINSNLIDDHAVCYVFYQTSQEGLNRDTTKPKVDYKNFTDFLINKMFILAKNSSIKEESILAKIELTMSDFKKQMGGDFKNYAIVINKYGQFCKDLIVNPESRMRYWVDRAIKENR